MEEPSIGLDLASKNNWWNVVKNAKQDWVVILTSALSPTKKKKKNPMLDHLDNLEL